MIQLKADGIELQFDPEFGMIAGFTVSDLGQDIAPLHTAPWVGTDEIMPPDAAPHLAKLGGDFFCAPFGMEVDGAPLHGWPANSLWDVVEHTNTQLRARLPQSVSGAKLTKRLELKSRQPFVYQTHTFKGGRGRVPFANHANLALQNGGLIRTSRKAMWMTPDTAPESDPARGRSGLAYPAECDEMARFPAQDGFADLRAYPWNAGCEDFVAGVEGAAAVLGWTAVTRPGESDLFLSLRRADQMPMTMLWHSNGGRDYAPWSGRHFGCLGVEEGAGAHLFGTRGAQLSDAAKGLQLAPDGSVDARHATGAIFWPSGEAVAEIDMAGDLLVVRGELGAAREVRFDAEFLEL